SPQLKKYGHYVEDLGVASHKLDHLKDLVDEEENNLHKRIHTSSSYLAYFLALAAMAYVSFRLWLYIRKRGTGCRRQANILMLPPTEAATAAVQYNHEP